ncbi:hypothetical protein C9374_006338 [Naegleria lovaniensis]|uniref:Uncharacterized protein n=1 Tax=Naegleria lovaniensis TaxID=51637 RepID=A0AA88KH43_NAELO|nr:uncharacterized protein C9374_006338 [Naegleria lovaniensis]KAG2381349.1 hypothetical protein C9374_006338 [Naegleria lovaniensis]
MLPSNKRTCSHEFTNFSDNDNSNNSPHSFIKRTKCDFISEDLDIVPCSCHVVFLDPLPSTSLLHLTESSSMNHNVESLHDCHYYSSETIEYLKNNGVEFYEKLCHRLRQERLCPFSGNFSIIQSLGVYRTMGNADHLLNRPFDVKISHHCSCIAVSDYDNKRVVLFDYLTKNYKGQINVGTCPYYLAIEKHDPLLGYGCDSLYVSCGKFVKKFDLFRAIRMSVFKNKHLSRAMWISEDNELKVACGMHVYYSQTNQKGSNFKNGNSTNYLIVSDIGRSNLKFLRCDDGSAILSISSQNIGTIFSPWMIVVDPESSLLYVSELHHSVKILKMESFEENHEKTTFTLVECFGENELNKIALKNPCGMVLDRISKKIILANRNANSLMVLTRPSDKTFFEMEYQDHSLKFQQPRGLCFDERTGLLYLVDCSNHQVHIIS